MSKQYVVELKHEVMVDVIRDKIGVGDVSSHFEPSSRKELSDDKPGGCSCHPNIIYATSIWMVSSSRSCVAFKTCNHTHSSYGKS
jgi:hypothetical protein